MPGPLSVMLNFHCLPSATQAMRISPSVLSVYLMALESRFWNTCWMRVGSVMTVGKEFTMLTAIFFGGASRSITSRTSRFRSTAMIVSFTRPTREYCKIPSIRPSMRRTRLVNRRMRSEEHTSELQSQSNLVCRLFLSKKKLMAQGVQYHSLAIDNHHIFESTQHD